MKEKRTSGRKFMLIAAAMAMALLLILPFAITPTVSLQTAESPVATNVMVGGYVDPPGPMMPIWPEGGTSLSSTAFQNLVDSTVFTGLVALNGNNGAIAYPNSGNALNRMYGLRINNQPLSDLADDAHYKDIVITLTGSSSGANKIQFYLNPNGSDEYIIREWGSGETAGKIVKYNTTGIEIEFDRDWMFHNMPRNINTYTINVSGIIANSGSIQFEFTYTLNNGIGGVTQFFGGDNRNIPSDYPTVFTGPNRPWHDGSQNVPWPDPWP